MTPEQKAEIRKLPFPLQGCRNLKPPSGRPGYGPKTRIPDSHTSWELAELAYSAYSSAHGTDQSLERLAQRGGFGIDEFAFLLLQACGFDLNWNTMTAKPPKIK